MSGPIFLDSWSSTAAELPKSRRTPEGVLRALKTNPRISTFDLSEYRWLHQCVNQLMATGQIVACANEPYPWHRFEIVAKATGGEA